MGVQVRCLNGVAEGVATDRDLHHVADLELADIGFQVVGAAVAAICFGVGGAQHIHSGFTYVVHTDVDRHTRLAHQGQHVVDTGHRHAGSGGFRRDEVLQASGDGVGIQLLRTRDQVTGLDDVHRDQITDGDTDLVTYDVIANTIANGNGRDLGVTGASFVQASITRLTSSNVDLFAAFEVGQVEGGNTTKTVVGVHPTHGGEGAVNLAVELDGIGTLDQLEVGIHADVAFACTVQRHELYRLKAADAGVGNLHDVHQTKGTGDGEVFVWNIAVDGQLGAI